MKRHIRAEDLLGRATCSIEAAATLLGIGRSTAYAAAHDGSLPVIKISHRLLVSVPRLLAMIGAEAEQDGDSRNGGRPAAGSGADEVS